MALRGIVVGLVLVVVAALIFTVAADDDTEVRIVGLRDDLSSELPAEHHAVVVFRPEVSDEEISDFMSSTPGHVPDDAISSVTADYANHRAVVVWRPESSEAERRAYVERMASFPLVQRVDRRK